MESGEGFESKGGEGFLVEFGAVFDKAAVADFGRWRNFRNIEMQVVHRKARVLRRPAAWFSLQSCPKVKEYGVSMGNVGRDFFRKDTPHGTHGIRYDVVGTAVAVGADSY